MAFHIRRILLLSSALASLFTAHAFAGFSFTTLGTFNGATGSTGRIPGSNLVLSNNILYGTTIAGGANGENGQGAVYSIPVTGGTPTVLASFNGTNGNQPAGLVLSGNTLYGTTAAGNGVVFSVPVTGGTPTILSTFNSTTGYELVPNIAISGNTLYGTSTVGGANNAGTIFSVPITGGTPTVLASFTSTLAGPQPGLIISGNTLYGTTLLGPNNAGALFSLPITGGTPTVLASFSGSGASAPNCPILFGNNFYGTTQAGATQNFGSVYSVPLTGGTPTVLASFNNTSNGWQPDNGVVISGNTIYGTTRIGGTGQDGVVFSVPLTGGTPTAVISFANTPGFSPDSTLLLSGNTLYGTTAQSIENGGGIVFSLTPKPIISLSSAPPTAFGHQLASLTITGSNGRYTPASKSFPSTSTGYVAVSSWNPTTDTETYALNIADSTPANLPTDIAALANQINTGAYNNFSVTASTTPPIGIVPVNGYDFYLTFTDPTLGSASDYFGFDLSQLNNTTDALTATAVAIAVPEPASLSLLAITGFTLLSRRKR